MKRSISGRVAPPSKKAKLSEEDDFRKNLNILTSSIISKEIKSKFGLIKEALDLVGDKLLEYTLRHDTSRLIQACLKYGDNSQKAKIMDAVKPSFVKLVADTYASHLAKQVYNSSDDKDVLMEGVIKKARKLIRNTAAVTFIDTLPKRYTKQFLECVLAKKENLASIAKKIIAKGTYFSEMAQTIILKAYDEDPTVINDLSFDLTNLGNSIAGARIMVLILAGSDMKQKKAIMRTIKSDGLLNYISDTSSAYIVLSKVLDTMDDMGNLNKYVLNDIILHAEPFLQQKKGSKVIASIFNPRSTDNFGPAELAIMDIDVPCRKPAEQRRQEILNIVLDSLLQAALNNCKKILLNPALSQSILEMFKYFADNKNPGEKQLAAAIAGLLFDREIADGAASHRTYRRLLNLNQSIRKQASKKLRKADAEEIGMMLNTKGIWILVTLVNRRKKLVAILKPYEKKIDEKKIGGQELLKLLR